MGDTVIHIHTDGGKQTDKQFKKKKKKKKSAIERNFDYSAAGKKMVGDDYSKAGKEMMGND